MGNSDNLFNGLVGQAINKAIDSTDEKNKSAQIRLFLAVAGILLFVGVEAVKVVFRKNFGVKGINIFRLVLCFGCFLALGIGLIVAAGESSLDTNWFSSSSFLISGAFYIIVAVYILRKGIIGRMRAVKSQNFSDFTGESDLLSTLATDYGWSDNKIKYLGEPLYTLLIGFAFIFYNPIASIPFIFCAISVWAHAALEFLFVQNPLQPQMNNQPQVTSQPQYQQPVKPNRVNTDF